MNLFHSKTPIIFLNAQSHEFEKSQTKYGYSIVYLVACLLVVAPLQAATTDRPNVVVILADDLGFSDLGCYGSEIETPNLDALANNGLRYTNFYNTGRCWPTRAAILTGYYPHSVRRDSVPGIKSGGRGVRPSWASLICRPLADAGYRTYHTGKWHVDGMPIESGFDRSYYLKDQHRFFNPTLHWKDDVKLPPVEKETDFYATIALGDHVMECLQEHESSHSDKPFFHYLAFAAPHFPLHALPDDIDKYRDTYKSGWEVIRKQRWQRVQAMGIIEAELSAPMRHLGPPYDFPESMEKLGPDEVNRPLRWDTLTEEQKTFQSTKMAIHAAMIDCMDRQIGRMISHLRESDQLDNTLIFFLSDNGASAEIMVRGDDHDPSAPMGSWKSHLCLGPGWSTACNTPFRYHKTWAHEGGTATPLIVHWPNQIKSKGDLRSQAGHVIDLWPTILEVAGLDRDESSVPAKPGRSLTSTFQSDTDVDRILWWSHEGNRALRDGDWKISVAGSDGAWELYDLKNDRAETNDLSTANPDRLESLKTTWTKLNKQHAEMAAKD